MHRNETEEEYAIRLHDKASRLVQALKETELINAFMNGIPGNVRAYVSSVNPNLSTFTEVQIATKKATTALKHETMRAPTNPPPVRIRRPINRLPTPSFVYQPHNEAPIHNLKSKRPKRCIVCAMDHYTQDCPTLNDEQKKHAKEYIF
jgi:hypothetical protein